MGSRISCESRCGVIGCINDTYEPGSTFKIITTAAAFEEGVVSLKDPFHCPGYQDRRGP